MSRETWGVMAEVETGEQLLRATEAAYKNGYRKMDAYSPEPVEGLVEALGKGRTRLPLIVLIGGIIGGAGGYFLQYYAMVIDYPLNVGGRPLHSWPLFIPVTFELTVLAASVAGLVGMFVLNRFPQPYHPVFNAPGFERATTDRYFLCIEATDPAFDVAKTRRFLEDLEPVRVTEVKS